MPKKLQRSTLRYIGIDKKQKIEKNNKKNVFFPVARSVLA